MVYSFKAIIKKLLGLDGNQGVDPAMHGEAGVAEKGHREYVGGMWDEIGKLQFDFLISKGLKPEHYFLDIACGSLRLGVKAIPYLEKFHYLGVEKEQSLIDAGKKKELQQEMLDIKQPELLVSDAFEFNQLSNRPDYAIAQSLFTHLPDELIEICFRNLSSSMNDNGVFYATFFIKPDDAHKNPVKAHDHGYFAFSKEEMCAFGNDNGFIANYIGDWGHPRNQVMVEYRKKK